MGDQVAEGYRQAAGHVHQALCLIEDADATGVRPWRRTRVVGLLEEAYTLLWQIAWNQARRDGKG